AALLNSSRPASRSPGAAACCAACLGPAPALAARRRGSSSAARSLQVGDGRQLCDDVTVEREVSPLPALLALEQSSGEQALQMVCDGPLRKAQRLDQLADAHRLDGIDERRSVKEDTECEERFKMRRTRRKIGQDIPACALRSLRL